MAEPVGHLLQVENLSVDFSTAQGIVHAVRDVSFHVDPGETLAILGESGSGKSVSASAILGIIDTPPGIIRSGRVLYRGNDLLTASTEERRSLNGRKIAMIFQDPLAALNPVYSIGWQIAETFRVHGIHTTDVEADVVKLLQRVGIPNADQRVHQYPHQFSGGQRQRVMIAMAIALRPDLLVADEPTTALDVTVQAQILRLLKDIQAETGMGLFLITHDLDVVAETADRVAVMKDGRFVEAGDAATVFRAPQHAYTRELLEAIPGRHLEAPPGSPLKTGETILSVEGLSKNYRMVKALSDVSFELAQGETLGVVGESGSGKTTLVRTLLGLETASAGVVRYKGRDVSTFSADELFAFRRQIQVVFQDPTASLNPFMTVEKIIGEPWLVHKDVVPKRERRARIEQLLTQVGLGPDYARRYPHQLSGGQRQRIAIARALALNPEILICDEAVSALDVSTQSQVIALLRNLRDEFGLSYLFVAHGLRVVRDFCDRVLVMHNGRVVEHGNTEQIFDHPADAYTRELIAASPVTNFDDVASWKASKAVAAEAVRTGPVADKMAIGPEGTHDRHN